MVACCAIWWRAAPAWPRRLSESFIHSFIQQQQQLAWLVAMMTWCCCCCCYVTDDVVRGHVTRRIRSGRAGPGSAGSARVRVTGRDSDSAPLRGLIRVIFSLDRDTISRGCGGWELTKHSPTAGPMTGSHSLAMCCCCCWRCAHATAPGRTWGLGWVAGHVLGPGSGHAADGPACCGWPGM
jgi:hypothetical protein